MQYIFKSQNIIYFLIITNLWVIQDVFVKKLNIFFKITIRRKNYKNIIQQQNTKSKNINNVICKKILKNIQKKKWPFFNNNIKYYIEILILEIHFNIILYIKKFSIIKIISNNKNLCLFYMFKTFFIIFIIETLKEKKIKNLSNYNFLDIILKINYYFFKHYNCKLAIRRYISDLNLYSKLNSLEIFMILFFIQYKKSSASFFYNWVL